MLPSIALVASKFDFRISLFMLVSYPILTAALYFVIRQPRPYPRLQVLEYPVVIEFTI